MQTNVNQLKSRAGNKVAEERQRSINQKNKIEGLTSSIDTVEVAVISLNVELEKVRAGTDQIDSKINHFG